MLSRGYSFVRKPDGTLVSGVKKVKAGDRIRIQLKDGALGALVEETEVGKP